MSASVITGFCRITVVAPSMRVDIALPEDVPLAELLPDVLRMADQWQSEGAHTGFVLARLDGGELDTGISLAAQGVRSGDLLYLRPATDTLPPPVYDDVVDAIAKAVSEDHRIWGGEHFRLVGLIGGSALLALGAWVLWSAGDPHGRPAVAAGIMAVLLAVGGGVRSQVYRDHSGGAILGACAVPYAFLCGLGVLPLTAESGLGRSHFIVGCSAVLVVAVLGALAQEQRSEPALAAAIAAAVGAVAGAIGLATHAAPAELAAGAGTVAVAAIGFLPGLAMRTVRFPMPQLIDGAPQVTAVAGRATLPRGDDEPVDLDAITRRVRRGHEILTGLVAACALITFLSAVALAFTGTAHGASGSGDRGWDEAMAAILGLAAVSRARLFRRTAQVATLFFGGVAAEAALLLGAAGQVSGPARQTWFFGIVLVAALILVAVAFALPQRSLSPRWAHTVDLLDGLLLAAVIPVLLGVLDIYSVVRSGLG
jgi:type VII secretion integral membrane protein EccD